MYSAAPRKEAGGRKKGKKERKKGRKKQRNKERKKERNKERNMDRMKSIYSKLTKTNRQVIEMISNRLSI